MTATKHHRYRLAHASRTCANIPESPRYPTPPQPPPSSPMSPPSPQVPSLASSPQRQHLFNQQPPVCNPTKILPLTNTFWNLTKPECDAWVNQRRTPSDCALPTAAGLAVSVANQQAVSLCNVATTAAQSANQSMDMMVRQRTPRSTSTNITAPMDSSPSAFDSWNGYTSWASQTSSSQNPYQPQYLLLPGAPLSGRLGNPLQRDLVSPNTVRTLLLPRRNIQTSCPSIPDPATQSSTCLRTTRCLTPLLAAACPGARSLPSSPSSESLIQYFPNWPPPWPSPRRSASSSPVSTPVSGRSGKSTPLRLSRSNIEAVNASRAATPMRSIAAFSGITPASVPANCMDDFTQCSRSSPSVKLLSQSPCTSNATSREDFSGRTMVKVSATCPELRPPYATHEKLELGDPWNRNSSKSNRKILHARRNLLPCFLSTSDSTSQTSKFTSISSSNPSIAPSPPEPEPESPRASAVHPLGGPPGFWPGMQQLGSDESYFEQSGMQQPSVGPGRQASFEQSATQERRLVPYKPSNKAPCVAPRPFPCNTWNNVPWNNCFNHHPGQLTSVITCPNFKFRGGQYFKETDMHRLNGLQDLSDYATGPCMKPRRVCFAPSCPTLPTWSVVNCNCCCNMCKNNMPRYERRNGLDPEDQIPCTCQCHGAGGWGNWLRESNGKPLVASSFPSWNNPCNGLRPCTSDSALAFLQSGSLGPPLGREHRENQRAPYGLNNPKEPVSLCRQCAHPSSWDAECYWNTIAHAHGMMPEIGGKGLQPSPCTDVSDYIHPERFILGSKMIKDIDAMRNNGLQDDNRFLDPAFASKKLEETPSCPQLNPGGNAWPFTCGAPNVEPSDTESTQSKDSSVAPIPCPFNTCQLDWCPDSPGHPCQLQPPDFWRNWRSNGDRVWKRRRSPSQGTGKATDRMTHSRNRTNTQGTFGQMIPFQNTGPSVPCTLHPLCNFPFQEMVPNFPNQDFCAQTDLDQESPPQNLGPTSSQGVCSQAITGQGFPYQGIGQSFSCMSFPCQNFPGQYTTGQVHSSPGFPRQMMGQSFPCLGFPGQYFYGARFPDQGFLTQGTGQNFSRSSRQSRGKRLSRQSNVKGVSGQGVSRQGVSPQGVPCQGVPCQGVPCQGVPCQGVPCQGVPCQGVPRQGASPQGVVGQGFTGHGFIGQSFPCQGFYDNNSAYQNFSCHSFPFQGQENFNNVPTSMSTQKIPCGGRPLKGDQMPRAWPYGGHWPCGSVCNPCPQMNAPTWLPWGNPCYTRARTESTAGSTLYSPRDLRSRRSKCLPSSTPQTPDSATNTRTKGKSSDTPRFDIAFTDSSTPVAVVSFEGSSSPGASTSVDRGTNHASYEFARCRTSTRSTMLESSIPYSCVQTQTSRSTPQSKVRCGHKMRSKGSTQTYTTSSRADTNARYRPLQDNTPRGTCTDSRSSQTQQRQSKKRELRRDSPAVAPRSGATTSASLCYFPSSSWASTLQGARNWNRPQLMHVTSTSRQTGTTSFPYSHDISTDGALCIGSPATQGSSDQTSPLSSASETCILRRPARDGFPQGMWVCHAMVPETNIRLRKPRSRFSITDYDSQK